MTTETSNARGEVVAWFPTNAQGEIIRTYGDGSPVYACRTKEEAEQAKRCHLGATGPVIPLYAAPPSAPAEVDYAKRLATSLWQRHYREDAPQWEPFDDLPGLLSQIDNMIRGLTRAPAAPQQPAAPSGEAGAFDANFLQSVASLCRAAYDLCQPKPQRTPEDAREHYGELCLLELTSIADEIERRLAAADATQPGGSDNDR